MQVFDFELSADEMKLIESFNIPFRACIPMIEVSQGQDLGGQNGLSLISFLTQLRSRILRKGDVCLWVSKFWVQIVLKSVYQSILKTLIQPCNCAEALILG